MKQEGILAPLRVLDLTRMLSGPYCTMMLADHGAEVIKIENDIGDSSRSIGPYRDDDPQKQWSGYFVSLNRGKKSVVLDLKTEEGRRAFFYLLESSDILIENFRPGVMERLGLDYEILAKRKPELIYAAIRGFGDPRFGKSPYNDWPSYDVVAQAMGGLMGITGLDAEHPMKVGPGIGDIFSGLMMAFAIMAALRHKEQTGEGQFIDISMYDAMVNMCERIIYQYDYDGTIAKPEGNAHPLLAPFGLFKAKDGWVSIGIVENNLFHHLLNAMGREELKTESRFASKVKRSENAKEINAIVSEWAKNLTRAELAELLGGKVPFGPVNNAKDIFADPHMAVRETLIKIKHPEAGKRDWQVVANPIKFSKTPALPPIAPSQIGADNAEILQDFDVWKLKQSIEKQ